jgi:hypothetical protein
MSDKRASENNQELMFEEIQHQDMLPGFIEEKRDSSGSGPQQESSGDNRPSQNSKQRTISFNRPSLMKSGSTSNGESLHRIGSFKSSRSSNPLRKTSINGPMTPNKKKQTKKSIVLFNADQEQESESQEDEMVRKSEELSERGDPTQSQSDYSLSAEHDFDAQWEDRKYLFS